MTQSRHAFILVIALLLLNYFAFAQIGKPKKSSSATKVEWFEHNDCGLRFPQFKAWNVSTAIEASPFREVGEGSINKYSSDVGIFDFGCIALFDDYRMIPVDELVAKLHPLMGEYLMEPAKPVLVTRSSPPGKQVFEFEIKSDTYRRIRYVFQGNRIEVLAGGTYFKDKSENVRATLDAVEFFSVKELAEKIIANQRGTLIPQVPALRPVRSDAANDGLTGRVRSVRLEALDETVLIGSPERRILADDSYDPNGNIVRSYFFQNSGVPTSVTTYGVVKKQRVSSTVDFDSDSELVFGISDDEGDETPSIFDTRYEYRYDQAGNLIAREEFDPRGKLLAEHRFERSGDIGAEFWTQNGKTVGTTRFQYDLKGNPVKSEFWWYDQTDRLEHSYEYVKFDNNGNWIERLAKTSIKKGVSIRKRTAREFRLIKYY